MDRLQDIYDDQMRLALVKSKAKVRGKLELGNARVQALIATIRSRLEDRALP